VSEPLEDRFAQAVREQVVDARRRDWPAPSCRLQTWKSGYRGFMIILLRQTTVGRLRSGSAGPLAGWVSDARPEAPWRAAAVPDAGSPRSWAASVAVRWPSGRANERPACRKRGKSGSLKDGSACARVLGCHPRRCDTMRPPSRSGRPAARWRPSQAGPSVQVARTAPTGGIGLSFYRFPRDQL
jgi:hypothetical protein